MRLTPSPDQSPETFRCDPGRDHHITAAHLICRPSEKHIRECLINFGAPAYPMTRLPLEKQTIVFQSLRAGLDCARDAITSVPGSRCCNKFVQSAPPALAMKTLPVPSKLVAFTSTRGVTSWDQYRQVFDAIVRSNGRDDATVYLQLCPI